MLRFEVTVEDILIDGHPICWFTNELETAAKWFDDLMIKYPYNKVTIYETTKVILIASNPKERPAPACPFNHTGIDFRKMPVIYRGSDNLYKCRVCGWSEK